MEENSGRTVLCGANAYEQKYYFNEKFVNIPESIREELHIICVLFTEEVGGVFTIVYEEDGSVSLETDAYEEDILYDAGTMRNIKDGMIKDWKTGDGKWF